MIRSVLCRKRGRVEAHLLEHSDQSVRTGGAEVLAQVDAVDEVQVSCYDIFRCLIAQYANQQGYNSLYQYGIRVAFVVDSTIRNGCGEPYLGLASVNQVLLGTILFVERFEVVAQFDKQGVAIHPVVKLAEFIDNLVLYFVNAIYHCFIYHCFIYHLPFIFEAFLLHWMYP